MMSNNPMTPELMAELREWLDVDTRRDVGRDDGIAMMDTIDAQAAEIARLREALVKSEDAMREMFRYYDGGETRGSYDGKPERAQLRTAWQIARAAINAKDAA